MTQEDASRGWTCPACGRKVPSWIGECRCGALRPQDTRPADADARDEDAAAQDAGPPRSVPVRWAAIACVAVALIVTLWLRPRQVPRTPASLAPAAATAPVAPVPGIAPASGATPVTAAPLPDTGSPSSAAAPGSAAVARSLLPAEAASLEEVAQRVIRSVVSIDAGDVRGTGFFTGGMILTNAHVVGSQGYVKLRLADGQSLNGQVLRSLPGVDLAVVRPERVPDGQPMLPLRTIGEVRVGQEVLAIGSALGVLQNTVTRGIVSAVRNVGGVTLIQTDAAVNHGNSGGPLVDRQGGAVGITTMKASGQAESIGFAVAAEQARSLLDGRIDQAAVSGGTLQDRLHAAMTDSGTTEDVSREEATAEFEKRVRSIAQAASRLDGDWANYRSTCLASASIPRGYDREWFVLLDRTPQRSAAPACGPWTDSLVRAAETLRAAMVQALEAARVNGVFPGDRRDICRTNRLEWTGWGQ